MTSGRGPAELFATPPPASRSWAAVVTSASLHIALVIGFTLLAARIASLPALPREYRPVTFVMMAPLPIPHEPTPTLELSPKIQRREPDRPPPVELAKPAASPPAPAPAPRLLAHSEPGSAPPEPVRPAAPVVAPTPKPVRPPVTVGLFADSPTVHEAEPVKTVQTAGFDAASLTSKAGDTKSAAVVGAFDSVGAGPPAKTARPGAVVASTGFGSDAAATGAGARKTVTEVRPSGFDALQPAAPPARLTPARIDVPVEILFKPTPVYTDEARMLKLEGDVLLDVEFAASGSVSVLQVVRGLGHGLDEAATAAAKQIRFKPAQSAGHPINFRTTVHIVFRLA